jgi:hypothetical protein
MHSLALSIWAVGLAVLSRPCTTQVVPLSTNGWSITADSFQTGYEPTKALDGITTTSWRSKYSGGTTPYPHFLVIDMNKTTPVAGMDYLSRQATSTTNGNIGQYEVALSADNITWGAPVATGTWSGASSVEQVRFAAAAGRYIRLLALSEYRPGNPWANAAEITVYGMQTPLDCAS